MDPVAARRLAAPPRSLADGRAEGLAVDPSTRLKDKWILVIDDDPAVRVVSARILLEHGAMCQLAGRHEHALKILEREPQFEVAILDYQMPDGDGPQLVPQLRARRPDLLVVGSSGSDRRREFRQAGVERFLEKPWGIDDLIAAIGA